MSKGKTGALSPSTQAWLAYVDAEVEAVCRARGWHRQIRRKWSVRDMPVSRSGIDDYEWKLIPGPREASGAARRAGTVVEDPKEIDEGTYFVLGYSSPKSVFVLQHDTIHAGELGDHFFTRTYTEIDLRGAILDTVSKNPPAGWLQRFLLALTDRFQPNWFSVT